MNQVFLTGNLVDDPHVTTIKSGNKETKVVTFRVAVNRKFKRSDGEYGQETTFIKAEAWAEGAEVIGNVFHKGDKIFIDGALQNESWVRDGKKHHRDKVRINQFEKLSFKEQSNNHQTDNP